MAPKQRAFDAAIERQLREVEALAAQAADSPVRRRLRSLGKLR
jgi:type II secretory pathway component PulM